MFFICKQTYLALNHTQTHKLSQKVLKAGHLQCDLTPFIFVVVLSQSHNHISYSKHNYVNHFCFSFVKQTYLALNHMQTHIISHKTKFEKQVIYSCFTDSIHLQRLADDPVTILFLSYLIQIYFLLKPSANFIFN